MENFVMVAVNDPISFEDALKDEKWRTTMDAEIEAIEKNDTRELTNLPTGAKKVGVEWVYKMKPQRKWSGENIQSSLGRKGIHPRTWCRLY